MLYCSNRASICSHALILLSPSRWLVMTGWLTSISLQPFTKHVWIVVLDVYKIVSTLCFKHVWIMVPCLGTSTFLLVPWSNTFGLRILVCVHASVPVPYLCTRIRSSLVQTRLFFWLLVCLPSHPHLKEGLICSTLFACQWTSNIRPIAILS